MVPFLPGAAKPKKSFSGHVLVLINGRRRFTTFLKDVLSFFERRDNNRSYS